ncbi:MAG: PfkB family carbohydrate kinase, partial [Salinibacter sp.]
MPAIPGALTPTELQTAHEAGADVVKVFPASTLGKDYLGAVKAPLPHLRLCPTGGVSLDDAGDWLRAGAAMVGVGSALLDGADPAADNYTPITENAHTPSPKPLSGVDVGGLAEDPPRPAVAQTTAPGARQRTVYSRMCLRNGMTVLTLGELLIRLSPPGHQRFVQADRFDAEYGGSEANVAVALSRWGIDSAFVTRLPEHALGQAAVDHLRRYGVDTTPIVRDGARIGKYFLETGAAQRGSSVIYDRADSAAAALTPDELDLEALVADAKWVHWSGITPALGSGPHRVVEAASEAAQAAGGTVSCDLNFRGKLWREAEAQQVMRPLMEHVDVCVSGRGDPFSVLG